MGDYGQTFPKIYIHGQTLALMRILYICSKLPVPVRSGVDLRVGIQVQALEIFCDVRVFASDGPGVNQVVNISHEDIKNIIVNGAKPFARRFDAEREKVLKGTLEEFAPQIIIISKLESTTYLETIFSYKNARLIMDLDESAHQVMEAFEKISENPAQRMLTRKYLQAVCDFEAEILPRFSQLWVSSELEVERVQRNYSEMPELICVPNAIDFDNYETAVSEKVLQRVVFQAGFAYGPNDDAAHFIIEDLIPIMQDFTFQFIGSNIPDWMKKSASAQVELLNNVDTIAPFLAQAGIVIIPLRAGAGTRLKALEAFASKTAVVSTAIGVEGLGLVDGLHYLEATEPQEFADACRRLVADPDLYWRITEAAFEHAQANYSLGVVSSILKSTID